ncbi:MAG: hypothetical protein LBJ78_01585 [Puniceicoccales bacterium]|nr:hypothetical protein [Puniceicoccales bacterium]
MSKTINTIIKTGFVMVGLMGEVTLNAWWCEDCHEEHEFDSCDKTGKVNSSPSRVANFPLVGYVVNGDEKIAVHGPITPRGDYRTLFHVPCRKIAGQWFLTTNLEDVLAKNSNLFDNKGEPLRQAGALANGCPVYEMPESLSLKRSWYRYLFVASRDNRIHEGRESPIGAPPYYPVEMVRLVHSRFGYNEYKYCSFPRQAGDPKKNSDGTLFLRGACFDGRVWVDINTGQIYNSLEEMPQGYKPNCDF